MACDCEKKPAGAPEDSVRNAAALWLSAGKTAGFTEGVRYAVASFQQSIPAILANAGKYELASTKALRLRPALEKLCADLLAVVADKKAEGDNLNRLATMMADRLEAKPARRTLAQRLRAAALALRA